VNGTYDFDHVSGRTQPSVFGSFDLPIFNRNQGEIAQTGHALTEAQEQQHAASDTVLSDFLVLPLLLPGFRTSWQQSRRIVGVRDDCP
jgi:hypothetical protein